MKIVHVLACASVLSGAVPAVAHHSSAGVDQTKLLSADATMKKFAWSSPHAQIIVTYKDKSGKDVDLSLTTFAPTFLIRQGFAPKDFRPGDKIKIFWHPNRYGAGGVLAKIVTSDGRTMQGEPNLSGGPPK